MNFTIPFDPLLGSMIVGFRAGSFRFVSSHKFFSFLLAALGNLGSVLSSQGRFEEAEEALLGALRHRSNMADVHYNL
jgi:hypothetical protein